MKERSFWLTSPIVNTSVFRSSEYGTVKPPPRT